MELNFNQSQTAEITDESSFNNKNKTRDVWIETSKNSPYFVTSKGDDWTPIGQNDAITWVDLAGLFRRKNFSSVENYFRTLVEHKVTCLRLMLEYCQGEHRYIERPTGNFQPNMIRLWDDLFALCEKYDLRILLTPYDTFWMWIRWDKHPYNRKNGGTCAARSEWLTCKKTREAVKNRLDFAATRWGGSGALFAWDIWNEIHPAHAGNSAEIFTEFIDEISGFLRKKENYLYGRTHPQTVSVFNPVIDEDERIVECVFRHPALDFANLHFYEKETIDNPRNTVDAAISAGKITCQALSEITDMRPFFDSEHGPIHSFKDRKITLPERFDDEYFRHIQWAHFASGGAGGGMRWANRHPHALTKGMRAAQLALADFLPLIEWRNFRRKNLNREIEVSDKRFVPFGCGDDRQAIVWLLRTDSINKDGTLRKNVEASSPSVKIPDLKSGVYQVMAWDTTSGAIIKTFKFEAQGESQIHFSAPPITTDMAFAVRRVKASSRKASI